jgi:hypothetical protein
MAVLGRLLPVRCLFGFHAATITSKEKHQQLKVHLPGQIRVIGLLHLYRFANTYRGRADA